MREGLEVGSKERQSVLESAALEEVMVLVNEREKSEI